jgi:hypothetical protein
LGTVHPADSGERKRDARVEFTARHTFAGRTAAELAAISLADARPRSEAARQNSRPGERDQDSTQEFALTQVGLRPDDIYLSVKSFGCSKPLSLIAPFSEALSDINPRPFQRTKESI